MKRRCGISVRYNTRAEQWVNEGITTFANKSFTISGIPLEAVTTHSGYNYPVRDTCSKKGDPAEKCLYTEAYYYTTMTRFTGDRFHAKLASNGVSIVDQDFDGAIYKFYSASDLGCTKDTSKCSSKCSRKGGVWDRYSRQCTVTLYLNEVCYRVAHKEKMWVLDSPP